MFGTIMTLCLLYSVGKTLSERGKTKVTHSRDFFGGHHTTVDGPCFRCDGTGKVHGRTCRKCGGSGRYHRKY